MLKLFPVLPSIKQLVLTCASAQVAVPGRPAWLCHWPCDWDEFLCAWDLASAPASKDPRCQLGDAEATLTPRRTGRLRAKKALGRAGPSPCRGVLAWMTSLQGCGCQPPQPQLSWRPEASVFDERSAVGKMPPPPLAKIGGLAGPAASWMASGVATRPGSGGPTWSPRIKGKAGVGGAL